MECFVCGQDAHNIHWSIMGSIPFHLCKKHYEETYPFVGWTCDEENNKEFAVGLKYKNNNETVKYFNA